MAILWKSVLATLAGAAVLSAQAAPYDRYRPYDDPYSYSYDRYGNAYKRYGYYDRDGSYRECVNPAPLVDPSLATCDPPRAREYFYTPEQRELEMRREFERAQRGDFDGSTPHPLSKNYSPG
jgi:hypothetical protein